MVYKPNSTPPVEPAPDPLDVEVFLPLIGRPSSYVDEDELKQLAEAAAAARSCRDREATPEFVKFAKLAAQIGVKICQKAMSVEDADGHMASCLCSARRDDQEWFVGRLYGAVNLAGVDWISPDEVGNLGGYKGRLAHGICIWLYTAPPFAPYWIARQRLAERLGAPVPEYTGHLSAIVRQPAFTKVAYNILPIPPVDDLISYIRELSPAFGLRFYDQAPEISPDPLPDEGKFPAPAQMLECEVLMTQAAILVGAPDPEDHKGARTFLFNRLRAPGQLWLLNLPLAVADLLKHSKKINALSGPASTAPATASAIANVVVLPSEAHPPPELVIATVVESPPTQEPISAANAEIPLAAVPPIAAPDPVAVASPAPTPAEVPAAPAVTLVASATTPPSGPAEPLNRAGSMEAAKSKSPEPSTPKTRLAPKPAIKATHWDAIDVLFLSDFRIQVRCGSHSETYNWAEFGFADRRSKKLDKPDSQWDILLALAVRNGVLRNASEAGCEWRKAEKYIQTIRKRLRKRFHINADRFHLSKKVKLSKVNVSREATWLNSTSEPVPHSNIDDAAIFRRGGRRNL
jgi:hypothetical protein